MTRVAVVGAGLAGLAAAHELSDRGVDVTVFETRQAAGGVVRSLQLDSCLFERGPNTVPASAARFRDVSVRFGLESKLIGSSERSTTRWVWHAGRLVRVPLKPPLLVTSKLFSLRGKLKIATEPFRRWNEPAGEEPSFGALLRERLGTEPTERLAAAFVRGIYAGDIDRLGAKSAFPRLWGGLLEHRSLIRFARAAERAASSRVLAGPKLGPGRLLGIAGGLDQLPAAMGAALGSRLRLGTPIEELARDSAGFQLTTNAGRETYEGVVLATPARATGALAQDVLPPETSAFLEGIEHASLDVAHVVLERDSVSSEPEGFGFLVPPCEEHHGAPGCLGAIYSSNLFDERAPADRFTVSIFLPPDRIPRQTDQAIEHVARLLRLAHGWKREPVIRAISVDRWRDVIPQATVGHADRWATARAQLLHVVPGLVLAGTYTGGVAVENVLERGVAAAGDCHDALSCR